MEKFLADETNLIYDEHSCLVVRAGKLARWELIKGEKIADFCYNTIESFNISEINLSS